MIFFLLLQRWIRWFSLHVNEPLGVKLAKLVPVRFFVEDEITYRNVRLRVLPSQDSGFRIYFKGAYEPDQEDAFLSLVKADTLVYDIGANIGVFSCLAAKRLARVIAFEPSRFVYPYLLANIDLNNGDSIQPVNLAVSDRAGTVTFYETRLDNWGVGRIFQFGSASDHARNTYEIAASSLDHLVKQFGQPQVVKVDVEGAEWLIMQGATDLLRSQHPVDFLIEFHPTEIETLGGSQSLIMEQFKVEGYKTYVVKRTDIPHSHQWYVFSKRDVSLLFSQSEYESSVRQKTRGELE